MKFLSPLAAAIGLLLNLHSIVFAQGTVFTYQGQVTDNGTNFNGAGQFEFTLVTSSNANSQATATANMSGTTPYEYVSGYTLVNGGRGYTVAPAVTISGGGGSGAQATTTIAGGVVTTINFIAPGSGYSGTPTVVIAPPPTNGDTSYITYWSNDGTSVNGSQPANPVAVTVTNGLFTVVLGDTTVPYMSAIPAALFTQPDLQLRIWFNDGVNGFMALNPLQNLTPVPYAVMAQNAQSASNLSGTISLAQLPATLITNGASGVNISGVFSGSGYGLTGLNASSLASGVISNSLLPGFQSPYQTISGGESNTVDNSYTTIGGGYGNTAIYYGATVGGGYGNTAGGTNAAISGGEQNTASGIGAFIGGGGYDGITTFGNQANGSVAVVAGGLGNVSGNYATVSGGYDNKATNIYAAVGGGYDNIASGSNAFVGGGYSGTASGNYATVSGGDFNTGSGLQATVSGGYNNVANGNEAVVGGGYNNTAGNSALVAGGGHNTATNSFATVTGGSYNVASGIGAFVGGGGYDGGNTSGNLAGGNTSVVSGGLGNTNTGNYATISGGYYNTVTNNYATVSGGAKNIANAAGSVISGGWDNQATNTYATVPGGYGNVAGGPYSFAAGIQAQATNTGAFVWADDIGAPLTSITNNSVTMRASGGYRLFSSAAAGVFLAAGSTSWATISDKNAKKNFTAVNYQAVLDKLARVPVEQWNYKWEKDSDVPNLGPMAQDFKHAFYPGRDDKSITTLEFDGVELAAIQGLNQKLEEQKIENAELKQQLSELKQLVQSLVSKK